MRRRQHLKWMAGRVPVVLLAVCVFGVGLFASGALFLHHWSNLHSECQTALGQLDRRFNTGIQDACNRASTGVLAGWIAGGLASKIRSAPDLTVSASA